MYERPATVVDSRLWNENIKKCTLFSRFCNNLPRILGLFDLNHILFTVRHIILLTDNLNFEKVQIISLLIVLIISCITYFVQKYSEI